MPCRRVSQPLAEALIKRLDKMEFMLSYLVGFSSDGHSLDKTELALDLLVPVQASSAKPVASTIRDNAAISACAKGQEWQPALGLLSTTASAELEACTINDNAAISDCEKGQERQPALGLVSTTVSTELAVCTISDNAAINACIKGQEWQSVSGLLCTMASAEFFEPFSAEVDVGALEPFGAEVESEDGDVTGDTVTPAWRFP